MLHTFQACDGLDSIGPSMRETEILVESLLPYLAFSCKEKERNAATVIQHV